jgi:hypothetical protein
MFSLGIIMVLAAVLTECTMRYGKWRMEQNYEDCIKDTLLVTDNVTPVEMEIIQLVCYIATNT